MTDLGRDGPHIGNEDRLPWLEPVDDAEQEEGIAAGRLILGVIAALVIIGLIVGGIAWLSRRNGAGGQPGEIAAPATPYKVKPVNPGGMQVAGQDDSSYAASEGVDTNAAIDLNAVPEKPITPPPPAPAKPAPAPAAPVARAPIPAEANKAPVPAPTAAPVAKAPAPKAAPAPAPAPTPAATPAPTASGGAIQLGAYSSNAKANAAWKAMTGRFDFLAPLTEGIETAKVGNSTIYRLRATGAGAVEACKKLKVAGETCLVIGK